MKLVNNIFKILEESVKDFIKKTYKVEDKDFEKTNTEHAVCSIAQTKDGYVGFSHRASCEFKIGDMQYDPEWRGNGLSDEELSKMDYVKRGSIKIKTMEQAKIAASNFAREVS
jgi:hypothetical protein